MREVYSSAVEAMDYQDGNLIVRWSNDKKGRISIYEGVPEDVANRVMNAPSIGTALRTEIIPVFKHSYSG